MVGNYFFNEDAPIVSIVITTNNRVNLLAETLCSILSQTFSSFELIIVDNMSEDGTREYIDSILDARIHYFRNINYGIIAINRNFGIRHAKGKYIAFCDDDDLWLPNKLTEQVSLMERQLAVALCYSNAESFIGTKILDLQRGRKVYRSHFFELLRGNYIPNSSVMVRRSIFQELGLLNENPQLREDYEMWLRVANSYELMGIEASLIRYRIHSSNAAGNSAAETMRAIRTVKSVGNLLGIPFYFLWPNIAFQYLKYFIYIMARWPMR
jgi:glycosyltransferase involved in cell wall biosynthesis